MKFGNGNPILMAIVAACALGMGVTGTMLWMQTQAPKPVALQSAPAAPVNGPSAAPSEMPSKPSTVGMTPAQTALTLGNWHYDSQQWPQAIAQYRLALSKGLDTPDVRTDFGNALRFAGQPQKALEQYQIAQKQDPGHEQSLFNQGGLWAFSLGNTTKAVAAWKTYLNRFPKGQSAEAARQFIAQHQK